MHHLVHCLSALFQIRVKHTECVCEFFIFPKVFQLEPHSIFFQGFGKLQGVMLQHVLFACRQITRRQRFDNFWAIRLFITFKCFSPLPFSIKITGKKKSDLVQFCRIEHSTDQSQCPHRQGSRHYSRLPQQVPRSSASQPRR